MGFVLSFHEVHITAMFGPSKSMLNTFHGCLTFSNVDEHSIQHLQASVF